MAPRSATLAQLPLAVGLPALNTLLRITVGLGPGVAWPARAVDVPSRLEDVVLSSADAGSDLVVAEPVYPGNLEPPSPGTGCLVTWVSPNGLHELAAAYVSTEQIGPALRGWRLAATGQVRRLQRRTTPRADCRLPVTVAGRLGHTLNIGEGGLRAHVLGIAPGAGQAVAVTVLLDSGVISPEAHVVYSRPLHAPDAALSAPPDRTELGVSFDQPWVYSHRLRAYVNE